MRTLVGLLALVAALGARAPAAHADRGAVTNPFPADAESAAIRALPPARIKDPFARVGAPRAVRALPERELKDPFAPATLRPEQLPERTLKNPFTDRAAPP